MMEEKDVLKILERIQVCLDRDAIFEAKEYVKVEIKNIKKSAQKKVQH